MQQMKLQIYSIMFVAFFIWLLIWCYRMPPSTAVPTKRCTKGFIFSFFSGAFYFVNNFLRFILCISYTRCIFAPNN